MVISVKKRERDSEGRFLPNECQADNTYWLLCGSMCHYKKIEQVCGVLKSKHRTTFLDKCQEIVWRKNKNIYSGHERVKCEVKKDTMLHMTGRSDGRFIRPNHVFQSARILDHKWGAEKTGTYGKQVN